MNERDYGNFLQGAIEEDDPLQEGLGLHTVFVPKIVEALPANEAIRVDRMIDILIMSVVVQHLEAARLRPESVPEVIELLRQKTIEKLNDMGPEE